MNDNELEQTFSSISPLVVAAISDLKSLTARLEFLCEYDRLDPTRYKGYIQLTKTIESEIKSTYTTLQKLINVL